MSFGFSLSDIVLSYQLAFKVYDRCFTRANGADYRYLEFGREIKALGASLNTLESVITNADRQNQLPRRPWHSDADRYGPSWDVLYEVAGDFKQTLEECDSLLSDRSKFQYSQGGFIENVMWWSSVEGDVNTLKERVRFHMMKLTFVAKPFEIQLLLGIKRELQLLRTDVRELRTILVDGLRHNDSSSSAYLQSLEVPPELAVRFINAMQINRPASMQSEADIPLKEGFDALVYHFAKSTILFNPRPELRQRDPEEPRYLNLVKCRWIAQTIRQTASFQLAGPDSLWADYLKELEDDIRGQFRRFDSGQLVRPPLDRILLLQDSCFFIWIDEEPTMRPSDLAEQRPLEDKILELDLPGNFGTRKSTLTIFQKSESKMRLVTTTTDEQNSYFHAEKETDVNMVANRLIPIYATPGDASTMTNNVMICSNEGQDPQWYSLKDADDVLHFQRALIGFRVFHQMLNVTWSIEGSSKPNKSGQGRLQFWQHKPFQPIGEDGERASGDRSSVASPQSPVPSVNFARSSTAFSTSPTLFSTGSVASMVNGPKGNATALVRAELPRVVIMTQRDGMYVFVQFKLHDSVFINHKKTKSPTTVVIDTKSKKIEFQRMCVQDLFSWDLACFRLPIHPEMRKLEKSSKNSEVASKILETVNKNYIVLTFPTPAEKQVFCEEFNSLEKLRDVHQSTYTKTLMAEKHMATNPRSPDFLKPSNRSISSAGSFLEPSKHARNTVSSLGSISSQSASAQISRSTSVNSTTRINELDGASRPTPELANTESPRLPELGSQGFSPQVFQNVRYSEPRKVPDDCSLEVVPPEYVEVQARVEPWNTTGISIPTDEEEEPQAIHGSGWASIRERERQEMGESPNRQGTGGAEKWISKRLL